MNGNIGYVCKKRLCADSELFVGRDVFAAYRKIGYDKIRLCVSQKFVELCSDGFFHRYACVPAGSAVQVVVHTRKPGHQNGKSLVNCFAEMREKIIHHVYRSHSCIFMRSINLFGDGFGTFDMPHAEFSRKN